MIDELAARFREKSRERIEEMEALVSVLDVQPPIPGAADRLLRHFHALAGLGSTYGYPEVSRHGDAGEALLVRAVAEGRALTREEVATLRALTEAVSAALA